MTFPRWIMFFVWFAISMNGLSARGQAVFSVPGFVDEEVFRGNGMITVRFDAGGRMWVTEKQGRILMAAPNTNATASFTYEYYEKPAAAPNWTTMPNFSNTAQVTFVKSGQQASFSIEPKEVNDYFAFRFSGQIDLPTTGTYTFYLSSDDGSLLYIDGNLVVNHNGLHGNTEMSGSAVLTAGVHAIVVEFFEAGGGEALTVQYAGPSIPKGPVSTGPFKAPVVVADLSSQVDTDGETGMTGLALDPDFINNRFIYLLYATPSDQRISRITIATNFTSMVPGSEFILLSGLPNLNAIHKAGDLAFHPHDPFNLYVMLGDDGNRFIVGQLTNYNGKILRINAADGLGLPTNPHYDGSVTSVASRIWSARYRNPFRFEFDPAAPIPNVLYISENGDGTDRLAQIAIGADGGWDNQFTVNSADGKRIVMQTSDPSKTALSIVRGGPFSPGGAPVLYNARYGGGTRNEVRRWTLTGTNLNVLTPIAADNGDAFYRGYENRGIVDFEIGPDGAMYYTDSGQGASLGTGFRLGRIRFVGGLPPVTDFTASPSSGISPLTVNFTDTSASASNTITSWNWSFGDGAVSAMQHPSHSYQTPGVYSVKLTAMDELGLTATKESIVTVVHPTTVHVSGAIYDGRSLPPTQLASATELRFYQMDGTTPLPIAGGTGSNSNVLNLSGGGVVETSVVVQITGPGMVISAGEASGDGVEPALVGVPLSVLRTNQSVSATFWLSDTMLRGRVTDTLGYPAHVDVGISRVTPGNYVAFAGGRDFRSGSGLPASGVAHRTVPDVLGFYHVPVVTGQGDAAFILDTSLDTLSATHGRVMSTVTVQSAASTIRNLTVGLYDGGTGEADLSGIPETPNVDFELQIQTIFSSSCAACHNDIASNSGGLDLQAGAALGELINKLSVEARGVKLVDPGSPERSYLMEKINATTPQIGTSMRPGDPMSLPQRALIRDWIRQLSPSGTIEFTSSDYSVTEGAESVTATITVRRTGSSIGTVGATVSTISGGTATPTSDYTVTSVPFAWDHLDQTDKVFSVSINSDNLAEGDETVVVGLGTLTGGAVTGLLGSTTLTIRDRAVDHWRYSEFGTNANTPNGLVTADFDNDGISNLAEYGLGTDPSVANSNPGTSAQIVPPGLLEYSFRLNVDAEGLLYAVQASDVMPGNLWENLATRTTGGVWNTASGVVVTDDGENGNVYVTDAPAGPTDNERYIRLSIEEVVD